MQRACGSPTDYTDLHGYWVQRKLPQITQIYTDVAQEKICDYPWNLWETFSQAKSVRICEICGKTSLKLRAEEPPTDYADLHGYWVQGEGHESHGCSTRKICDNPWNLWENILSSSMRRSLPQITQIYTDIGYGEKDTNHTDVAQEKSVTIRDICGTTLSRKICENL